MSFVIEWKKSTLMWTENSLVTWVRFFNKISQKQSKMF